MVSLTELDVSSNSLEELPIGIGLLRHMRTLYADDNFLSYLPAEVTVFYVHTFVFKSFLQHYR